MTTQPCPQTVCPTCSVPDEHHDPLHHRCSWPSCLEHATTAVQRTSREPVHARCDRHTAAALVTGERFGVPLVLTALPRYEPSLLAGW